MDRLIDEAAQHATEFVAAFDARYLAPLGPILRFAAITLTIFVAARLVLGFTRGFVQFPYVLFVVLSPRLGRAADEMNGDGAGFASTYVVIESWLHRLGLLWFIKQYDPEVYESDEDVDDDAHETNTTVGNTKLRRPESPPFIRASGTWKTLSRAFGRGLLFLPLVPLSIALVLPFYLNRRRLFLAGSVIAALAYTQNLVPAWTWTYRTVLTPAAGSIQLSTLIAAGTLLVIVYALFNSDVRGRAEVNKNASVNCRTTLLRVSPLLEQLSCLLEEIREQSIVSWKFFPTDRDLELYTMRSDLEWKGDHLLPRAFDYARPNTGKLQRFFAEFIDGNAVSPPKDCRRPEVDPSKVLEAVAILLKIRAEIRQLRLAGELAKLDRVITTLGAEYLEDLEEDDFGLRWVEQIREVGRNPKWWMHRWAGPRATWLHNQFVWASENESSPACDETAIRNFCGYLKGPIRAYRTTTYAPLWALDLCIHKMRLISRTVDASLRPAPLERMRQVFGK